jgi:hypothetical protein
VYGYFFELTTPRVPHFSLWKLERDKKLGLHVVKNRTEIHFSVPREWVAENVWLIDEVTAHNFSEPFHPGKSDQSCYLVTILSRATNDTVRAV